MTGLDPNRHQIPEWANWLAMDPSGMVVAYAAKPEIGLLPGVFGNGKGGYVFTGPVEWWVARDDTPFQGVGNEAPSLWWRESLVALKKERPAGGPGVVFSNSKVASDERETA